MKPVAVAIVGAVLAFAPSHAVAGYAVPLPAESFTVTYGHIPDGCGAASGCADVEGRELFVRDPADRWTLAHEIGHLYLEGLDSFWKGAITDRLGMNPSLVPWDNEHGCFGRRCPAEIAADAYAACALRLDPRPRRVRRGRAVTNPRGWESAYGYEPSRRRHSRVCETIRRSQASGTTR